MRMKSLLFTLFLTMSTSSYSGSIVSNVPESPDADGKYIIYLHGLVEETEGETGKYLGAVEAIAESSATVIAELRGDTKPNEYAETIKEQVAQLISKGVPAGNITISGYSKGAVIAVAAAGVIKNAEINYVLLAGCSTFLNQKYNVDPAKAVGRILAIYDSGDDKFGSCEGMISKVEGTKLEEVSLNSGKGHKVFRIMKDKFIEQWRDPLVDWAGA